MKSHRKLITLAAALALCLVATLMAMIVGMPVVQEESTLANPANQENIIITSAQRNWQTTAPLLYIATVATNDVSSDSQSQAVNFMMNTDSYASMDETALQCASAVAKMPTVNSAISAVLKDYASTPTQETVLQCASAVMKMPTFTDDATAFVDTYYKVSPASTTLQNTHLTPAIYANTLAKLADPVLLV